MFDKLIEGILIAGILMGAGAVIVSWLLWHFVLSHIHLYWK